MHKDISDYIDKKYGCFVAGTLVHTKEGLKPIEQIKVGDYVLSKPESGSGETTYKRVSKTFEYLDREVWYVGYKLLDGSYSRDFLVVTAAHPFWVVGVIDFCDYPDKDHLREVYSWQTVTDLYWNFWESGEFPVFELADGRLAMLEKFGPVIRVNRDNENQGVVYTEGTVNQDNCGRGLDFSGSHPQYLNDPATNSFTVFVEYERDEPYEHLEHPAIAAVTRGYAPLMRTVYNFEVEDNHTYYVGKCGVLVHNTSFVGQVALAFMPFGYYPDMIFNPSIK